MNRLTSSLLFSTALIALIAGCGLERKVSVPTQPVSNKVEELPGDAGIDGKTWLVSFDQAKRIAAETDRPILVDFTGSDWCGWCIKLDEEVFAKTEFAAWAKEQVVLLKLDFPNSFDLPQPLTAQNDTLAKAYGISGFPTILFLDATGQVLGKSGYEAGGPRNWIVSATEILEAAPTAGAPAPAGS